MKKKMVIGRICPNCRRDLNDALHTMWERNLNRPEIQPDIKKGRNKFAPFGIYTCPGCEKVVSIQLYGDLEGFISYLFEAEEDRKSFSETVLKQFSEKGINPKGAHLALQKVFGTKADEGVLLVP
jgi:Zn ribbon nucleic-acid-binding protein